jgi:hypothetical protein
MNILTELSRDHSSIYSMCYVSKICFHKLAAAIAFKYAT